METFALPIIKKMIIKNYDLYSMPFEINFSRTLNIIKGTNGTGKSTLLQMILYGVIGPYTYGIKFKNYQGRKKGTRPILSESFFKDRMNNQSKEAELIIEFEVANKNFKVVRSLFNTTLKEFSVDNELFSGENYKSITYLTYEKKYVDKENPDLQEITTYLIGQYNKRLAEVTGVPGGFNTLVEMFTDTIFFSEDREYSFWKEGMQELLVSKYILSSAVYESYLNARSETQYKESKYKQASEAINYARKFLKQEKESLQKLDDVQENIVELEEQIKEVEKKNTQNYKELQQKRDQLLSYRKDYEKLLEEQKLVSNNFYRMLYSPNYESYYHKYYNIMANDECPFCGKNHKFNLSSDSCILCHEKLDNNNEEDVIELDIKRKRINQEIKSNKTKIDEVTAEIARLEKDDSELLIEKINIQKKLAKLEKTNYEISDKDEERIAILQKDKQIAKREQVQALENERKLKFKIDNRLAENFKTFSEQFQLYGKKFFGEKRSIYLQLPTKTADNIEGKMIEVYLDDVIRDDYYSLSESQRIFVDLSFRFSILSIFHDQALFLCETPDSSLDKYHENNAVFTFINFINQGNTLFISANERESPLINELTIYYNESINIIDLTKISRYSIME